MANVRTDPVRISSIVNESFNEQCSLDDNIGDWLELEQFWGEAKQRLQDVDGQPLSSSLEDHLLHDNFLNEPSVKNEFQELHSTFENQTIVRGEDIRDIPTTYVAKGFRPQELIVIGTYVDKNILPGFKYKVRKNQTDEFLFRGIAPYLETIGLGYGKRLTFKGETLNANDNYFWSDSHKNGYGFMLQAINQNDVFTIVDNETKNEIGRVVINNPSLNDDIEVSSEVTEHGYIKKEVSVCFTCDIILNNYVNKQNIFIENTATKGIAVIARENTFSKAKIERILLEDFVLENCQLIPEK